MLNSCKSSSDVDVAASVFRAIANKRFDFKLRPGRKGVEPAALYQECHIEVIDDAGRIVPESAFRPALERLRATHSFDQFALWLVLDALVRDSLHILSVTVSAGSVCHGKWLASLTRSLAHRPDVASRFIIEVSNSSDVASAEDLHRFADEVRSLGCRVIVGDFGAADTAVSRWNAVDPHVAEVHLQSCGSRLPVARAGVS